MIVCDGSDIFTYVLTFWPEQLYLGNHKEDILSEYKSSVTIIVALCILQAYIETIYEVAEKYRNLLGGFHL
jgi:hypothetical protein